MQPARYVGSQWVELKKKSVCILAYKHSFKSIFTPSTLLSVFRVGPLHAGRPKWTSQESGFSPETGDRTAEKVRTEILYVLRLRDVSCQLHKPG